MDSLVANNQSLKEVYKLMKELKGNCVIPLLKVRVDAGEAQEMADLLGERGVFLTVSDVQDVAARFLGTGA